MLYAVYFLVFFQKSCHAVCPLCPGKKLMYFSERGQLHEMEITCYCVYVCVGADMHFCTYNYENVFVCTSTLVYAT